MSSRKPSIAGCVLLAVLSACGCRSLSRSPAVEPAPNAVPDEIVAEAMNPFLLTDLISDHVVVEVDWVEGRKPADEAIEALEATLRQHGPPEKRIRTEIDDTIPLARWEASSGWSGLEALLSEFVDHDPREWRRQELLYVLYAPRGEPWYARELSGMADTVTYERDGEPRTLQVVMLFTDEVHEDALLWITPAQVERATLIHEAGHVLGLVGNPTHTQRDHAFHCTESRCVMNRPGTKATLANAAPALVGKIPDEYCSRCRADIATARRVWQERAAAAPDFAERIRERRMRQERMVQAHWKYLQAENAIPPAGIPSDPKE